MSCEHKGREIGVRTKVQLRTCNQMKVHWPAILARSRPLPPICGASMLFSSSSMGNIIRQSSAHSGLLFEALHTIARHT